MSSESQAITKPDFPDWLSPMLVKELRQGLRSRVFIILFITIQLAMIFPAVFGLLDATTGQVSEGVTVFFWLFVTVPILLAMPMSGLSAIETEKQNNTLELLFLTRLTSRRILLGKWVAIVTQTLLIASAILPYAVLRYYLGNVNLVSDLQVIGWMLIASALLTALAVGLSPMVGRVGRILVQTIVVITAFVAFQGVFSGFRGSSVFFISGSSGASRPDLLAIVVIGVLLAAVIFEMGAGKIAPAAENHSTLKRLLALTGVVGALIYTNLANGRDWVWVTVLFIVAVVSIGAICEPVPEHSSTLRPFLRWGLSGRLFGRLFYPGWPAGFLFILLVAGLTIHHLDGLALRTHSGPTDPSELMCLRVYEVGSVGALLMPMALYRLARLKKTPPLAFYFGVQGFLCVLSVVGCLHFGMADKATTFEILVACFPTCGLCYGSLIPSWAPVEQATILTGNIVITVASLLILAAKSRAAWKAIAKLEKTAPNAPAATATPDVIEPVAAD